MRPVLTDAEFETIRSEERGFIFNDFTRGPDPKYNLLHWAGCRQLKRMNLGVRKLFFEENEDPAGWLNANKGPEDEAWRRCGTCGGRPDRDAAGRTKSVVAEAPTRTNKGPVPEVRESAERVHVVLAPDARSPAVRAWSRQRLQYGIKGWQADFKADLITALGSLSASEKGEEVLHAVFHSTARDLFDVENILFYNLESESAFKAAARYGLRFERSFAAPPPAPDSLEGASNYHDYEVVDERADYRHWERGARVATLAGVELDSRRDLMSLAAVWLAAKQVFPEVKGSPNPPDYFSLRVRVGIPESARPNPVAIVKTVFDGIISALHFHNRQSTLQEVSERLATRLGLGSDEVASLLSDPSTAVLGGRNLVWPRANGVQWGPADERCVAGELLFETPSADSAVTLSAKLDEVRARNRLAKALPVAR